MKKAANLRERTRVYFDVDNDKWPYKGVKGKAKARIITDKKKALVYGARILAKYVKKDQPLARSALERIRKGGYIVVEITPAYFPSSDYGKLEPKTGKSLRDSIIS